MGVSIFPDRDIFVILGVCSTMKTSLFSLVLCLMTVCVLPGAAQEDTRYRRYRIPSPVIQYHLFFMSTEGHKWWRIVQTVSPGGPYYEVLVSEGSPDDPVELTIRARSIFDVENVAPFPCFRMFVEDVESSDDVVFDDMNEHVVVAHVSVIVLHVIAVLFGQPIVAFDSGAECFKTFIQS